MDSGHTGMGRNAFTNVLTIDRTGAALYVLHVQIIVGTIRNGMAESASRVLNMTKMYHI